MVPDPVYPESRSRRAFFLIGGPIIAALAITAAVVIPSMSAGHEDDPYVSPLRTTSTPTTTTAATPTYPTYSTPVPTYRPAPSEPWTTLRADQLPEKITDALWERLYEKVLDGMDSVRANDAKARCDKAEKYRRPFLVCLIESGYWQVYDPDTRRVWK